MNHFEKFSALISSAPAFAGHPLPAELLMTREGELETFYSPFDYINPQARVTICGITPGLQQATNALNEARKQLRAGASLEEAKRRAKETASFSGPMRKNLIAMLDHIGLHDYLGINSCARLFDTHSHLVHYTSALRYPVFVNGQNYSGSPTMLSRASLRQQIDNHLAEEIRTLGTGSVYIPLGPKVAEVFQHLQAKGLLRPEQVLAGMPHPSGANAERISYFLGTKQRSALSNKTNPDTLDKARTQLVQKMASLNSAARMGQ